jgi:hypothetical protein
MAYDVGAISVFWVGYFFSLYLKKQTGMADITAEWYKGGVNIRQRLAHHELLGYKVKKTIRFEDVLKEARKFLEEAYKE